MPRGVFPREHARCCWCGRRVKAASRCCAYCRVTNLVKWYVQLRRSIFGNTPEENSGWRNVRATEEEIGRLQRRAAQEVPLFAGGTAT